MVESAEQDSVATEIAKSFLAGRSAAADPKVSPDGSQVACVVRTTSVTKNKTFSKVWLDGAPLSGGDHDGGPAWSPDGSLLAFTSQRSEKSGEATLHLLPVVRTGEVRTVCTMPESIDSVSFSPDGEWIGFTSRTQLAKSGTENGSGAGESSKTAPDDDVSRQPARKIERFFSRLNGENWIYDRPSHVYIVRADGTGEPRNLTPGPFQHHGVAWLGDSSGVITSAARHDNWDRDHAEDLYRIPIAGGAEAVRLTDGGGRYGMPSVSPDGEQVAFIGATDSSIYPTNDEVLVAATAGADQPKDAYRRASSGFDRTFTCTVGGPVPQWVDNSTLMATAEDRGETHVYRLNLDGDGSVEPVTSGPISVSGMSFAGGTMATTRTSVRSVDELFIDNQKVTNLTSRIAASPLEWERFTAPTADGTGEIDGWIMRPADFDQDKRYPVLLNVHGGPFTQYGEYFFDEAQMQAKAGFVVVLGNPRGGSGRDTAWGQAINGPDQQGTDGTGWGSVDVDDVMSLLQFALANFDFCDADRVGMLGGSYGGYMATWLAAKHGKHFRGICSERAVNNLFSLEWSSDIATAFNLEHGYSHLDAVDFYRERSPITYVADIEVPMLLIHSEEDWRCPIVQAEELWVALRLAGKEVDFYRFPGENHELSRSGSPFHRIQRAEIILNWFQAKLA